VKTDKWTVNFMILFYHESLLKRAVVLFFQYVLTVRKECRPCSKEKILFRIQIKFT